MLTRILGTVCILALLFGVIAYASGWIRFHSGVNTTTIEMDTGEMKESADEAIRKGKELLKKAGEKLNSNEDFNEPKRPLPPSDQSG